MFDQVEIGTKVRLKNRPAAYGPGTVTGFKYLNDGFVYMKVDEPVLGHVFHNVVSETCLKEVLS